MEPLFYTRISTAGWLFLGTILVSLWQGNPEQWNALMQDLKTVDPDIGSAIIGLVIALSVPPAVGLLLERIASSYFWISGDHMYKYSSAKSLGDLAAQELGSLPGVKLDRHADGALLHVLFYQCASENLIDWTRRRTTHKYTSVTSILAIITGLIVALVLLHAFSMPVVLVSIALVPFLWTNAVRESRQHREGVSTWASTFGVQEVRTLKEELQ